jgi:hypothetical protein
MSHFCRGRIAVYVLATLLLHGCASFTGYPDDPVPPKSDLPALVGYFDPQRIVEYNSAFDPQTRRRLRDAIVWGRIASYDIMFRQFRRKLTAEANGTNIGSDLTILILNGVGATTGTAATKAALAAASAGIVGAKGTISKTLFYEKTLPGLFSQMDASRTKILARILQGLSNDDSAYPLPLALIDLSAYADAGSIPGAIAGVTEQAALEKAKAEIDVSAFRTGNYIETESTKRLMVWLYPPNGNDVDAAGNDIEPNGARLEKLYDWLIKDKVDPRLGQIPYDQFLSLDNSEMEAARQRAIKDLHIP